jgi:hypothetical protein
VTDTDRDSGHATRKVLHLNRSISLGGGVVTKLPVNIESPAEKVSIHDRAAVI